MARSNTEIKEQEEVVVNSLLGNYVFMDKTHNALEVGLKTGKNVILYGPGGHGKSEYALEYLYEKGCTPYVITMGKGMTTDRLFGGLDVKKYEETGKIEYLVENSFMNHQKVIFEEIMDSPDYVLEQLKDILSSGQFRNGTQVFDIKTDFIVGCTNKTRAEFSKSDSLKALMERFPLEHNVVWDNYTEASYNVLLERRFGEGRVDPMIPFLLQEYTRNNILISPRIALDCYEVYETCGPDSLIYIAEFARKPQLISESVARFEVNIKFKQAGLEIEDIVGQLKQITNAELHGFSEVRESFLATFVTLEKKVNEVGGMSVSDDMAQQHAALLKVGKDHISSFSGRARFCRDYKEGVVEDTTIPDDTGSTGKKKRRSMADIIAEKS